MVNKKDLKEALRFYLVTDRTQSRGRSEEEIVLQAEAGGITALQLRGKELEAREQYHTGLRLRRLAKRLGLLFIVNDRVDIALAVEADGVHLGQQDLPASAVMKMASNLILGVTVEEVSQIKEAEAAGADYLGTRAVFPTGTKSYPGETLGLAGLKKICENTNLPVVAIGGMGQDNAVEVLQTGAAGIAVVSGIVAADDPEMAAREINKRIKEAFSDA